MCVYIYIYVYIICVYIYIYIYIYIIRYFAWGVAFYMGTIQGHQITCYPRGPPRPE